MKLSFKTTILIAAIATTLYIIALWLLAPLDISDFGGNPILWANTSTPLYWLCIVSYVLMCAIFYKSQLYLKKPSIVGRIISGLFIVIFVFLLLGHLTDVYRYVYYYVLRYSVLIVLWCMYIFYDKLSIQGHLTKPARKFRKNVLILALIMSVALVLHIVSTSIAVATSDAWMDPPYGDWNYFSDILQYLLRCTIYITFICLFWKILFFKEQ